MLKKSGYIDVALGIVLIVMVFSLFSDLGFFRSDMQSITGRATTADAETSAIIAAWFAINMSENLSTSGIQFYVAQLPSNDTNATGNYDNATGGGNQTKFYLTVDWDSNVFVDFCIKQNETLKSGSYEIPEGRYVWTNWTINNLTIPKAPWDNMGNALTNTSWDNNSADSIGRGNSTYFRFFLDVAGGQAPGTYRNKVNFKGVQTTYICGPVD